MSFGDYLLGAAGLAAIALALGFGAWRVRARLLPEWWGAPARLAEIVVGVSALLVIIELLGTVRILYPLPVVVASAIVGLAAARIAGPPPGGERAPAPPQMGRAAAAVAIVVAFVVVAHWSAAAFQNVAAGPYIGDDQWYHLPDPARFVQEGAVTDLHYASPSYLSWFHPLNSELFHALGMMLFDRDILSPLLNIGWLAVALLAGWCIGRPFGVAPLTAVATALVLDLPVFTRFQAGQALSDLFGVTFLLAAIALLANGRAVRDRAGPVEQAERRCIGSRPLRVQPAALAIAGLAAGLALGAKISFLPEAAVLTVGVIALAPAGSRRAATALWGVPLLATGAFWYLRNFVYAKNPFPYVSELGPIDLPGPDQGLNAGPTFSVSHYLFDGEVWSDHLLPGLEAELGPLWFAILAVGLGGMALAFVRRERLLWLVGATAIAAFLFYLFTPAAAEGPEGNPIAFPSGLRILGPALALGAVAAALGASALGLRARWLALAAAAVLVVVATRNGIPFWEGGDQLLGALGVAAALIAAPVGLAALRDHGARLAGGAAAAALALALAWPQAQDYLDSRYRTDSAYFDAFDLVPVFRWASDVSDRRIGTSGILQYGLYGEDLSNHVQFVGVAGSDHSFREITDCRTWRKAVNGGDYDYVVAMPRFGGKRAPQARWTSSPNSEVILRSGPVTVFRLEGELDPDRCRALPPVRR